MKKIIFFVLCFLFIASAAEAGVVSYVTGNLLPPAEEPEIEITDYELYEYSLGINDLSGKEVLNINLYDFCNTTELFDSDEVVFICKKAKELTIRLYKNDILQRKIPTELLTGYNSCSVIISDKRFTFSRADDNENICVYVKVREVSEKPSDYFEAVYSAAEKRLYVKGCSLPEKGKEAAVILAKKDSLEIGHIEQINVNYHGDFQADFKFTDDIEDFVIKLSIGENVYSIEEITVDNTYEEAQAVLNGVYENNSVSIIMDINNVFIGNNLTSKLVAAFYNIDGNLILCKVSSNFDTMFKVSEIPENAAKIRVFALDMLNGLRPQAEAAEILLN